MIENIIFDWSGVVKDCVLDHLEIVNKIFKQSGAGEITLEQLQENWRNPYMVFYGKYLPTLTQEEQNIAYKKAISESPKAKAYPGIGDLIKRAKKTGKKLFVVTSDAPDTILPEIKSFDLEGVFDDMVIHVYNKLEGTMELMKRNNLSKENTVVIGDTNYEIEIGRNLGMKSIAVTWGYNSEKVLQAENPDFLVHNVKELEKIIYS
jgi:phosphoglycolate phosphatase